MVSSQNVPKRFVLTSASLISSRITDNLSAKTGATNPAFYAAGAAPDDPNRYVLFEDGYAAQRSRSIEPSVEDGGRNYETFASCVRVYRLQAALGIVSDGTSCDVAGEECCIITEDEHFSHVWSLDFPENATSVMDSLLTADPVELRYLSSRGWVSVCVPTVYGRGPTGVCVAPALPFEYSKAGIDAASRGPFVLYANTSSSIPDTVALVRCVEPSTGHHLTTNSTDGCGAFGFQFDRLLGFGQPFPNSLFARPVRRCLRASPRRFYTAVNNPCLVGDVDDGIILYAS